MTAAPRFSIVTTCKGRLAHLRRTLPAMLAQADAEVIVVDFTCPDGAAAYVAANHPAANVVNIEGKSYYSHCEARNAGAAAALGAWLVFCDADIVLAPDCTRQLQAIMQPQEFGKFQRNDRLQQHVGKTSPLGANNLQGFQVVERKVFQDLGGYDTRLQGYAAGGDTEFFQRAALKGYPVRYLDESLVAEVIFHDDALRQVHSPEAWLPSYLRGNIYARLKQGFGLLRRRPPPDELCDQFLAAATESTRKLLADPKSIDLAISVDKQPLPLAAGGGFKDASIEWVLTVRVNLKKN